jgi:hypothetical protein
VAQPWKRPDHESPARRGGVAEPALRKKRGAVP